jgi:copper chaperone NosL
MRAAVLLLVATAACGVAAQGPPEIVIDRSACSHCSMLISEPRYAAAYQAPGAEPRVFDDIGCLLEAVTKESGTDIRFWFHDANHGEWIEGTTATFVASPQIRTPMGGGIIAFGDGAAADRTAAAQRGERIATLARLLERKGGSR